MTSTLAERRERFLAQLRSGGPPQSPADHDTATVPVRPAADTSAIVPTVLPLGPANGEAPTAERVRYEQVLDERLHPVVAHLSTSSGIAPEWVTGAAVLLTLARFTAESDLLVGIVTAADGLLRLTVRLDPTASFVATVKAIAAAEAEEPAGQAELPTVLVLGAATDTTVAHHTTVLRIEAGRIAVEYDADRHEPDIVESIVTHAALMLAAAVDAPDCPVGELPQVTDHDRQQGIVAPNGTVKDRPAATLLHLFDAAVRRCPDRPALADWQQSLSYAETADAAARLAHELRSHIDLAPEDRVAILVSRGDLRWVVACLATLRTGAAWLPLDPDVPGQRLDTLLRESGCRLVVTDARLRVRVPAGPWRIVDLDADAASIAAQPRTAPPVATDPRETAYVVYTSGSTGTPRAVVVEHRSIVNFVQWIQDLFALTPSDRILQFASPGFDVSGFEIFMALATGAKLWVVGDNERLSAEALSRTMRRERITVAELPPVLLEMMDPDRFPDYRVVSIGGEPFSGSLTTRWARGRRFVNSYGPTEATVAATSMECTGVWRQSPPIGRPGDNQRAYVLDEKLRPVPYGAVGELFLAGAGIARGYLGRPAATAERFRPDPFGPPGERMYQTGDMVRWYASGDLAFLGRRDRQVKIRGQRVELGEIEAALRSGPGVRAVVADVAPGSGQSELRAYVVADDGAADPDELRRHASARLPAYMVPSRFIPVPAIPMTPSGKVDLTALRAAGTVKPAENGSADDPELSAVELRLRDECYAVALPDCPVAPDTDFFAVGGTSIQMIRLMAVVQRVFGTEISMIDFLKQPTLRELARLLPDDAG